MFSPLSTSGQFAYIFHIKKFIIRKKRNYFHTCTLSGTAAEAKLSNSLSGLFPCPTSFSAGCSSNCKHWGLWEAIWWTGLGQYLRRISIVLMSCVILDLLMKCYATWLHKPLTNQIQEYVIRFGRCLNWLKLFVGLQCFVLSQIQKTLHYTFLPE